MKYLLLIPILLAEFILITVFSVEVIGTAFVIWSLTTMFYAFGIECKERSYE